MAVRARMPFTALAMGAMLGFAAWMAPSAAKAAEPAAPGCAWEVHRSDATRTIPAVSLSLAQGHSVRGAVPAGESRVFHLTLPAGHVAQGSFSGTGTVLDLQDDDKHVRRLAGAGSRSQPFMWVVSPEASQLAVRNTGSEPGHFELELVRPLAPRQAAETHEAPEIPSPRLRALRDALHNGADTESFWAHIREAGTPLVERVSDDEALVSFLWRGRPQNVRLFGSPTGNHDALAQLEDSDVWWATFRMPTTARLSYRLAPDVPQVQGTATEQRRAILATARRDPFNPHVFPDTPDTLLDAHQGASVLTLPDAPPQPWVRPRAESGQGTLARTSFDSAILGNQRDIWLYRPAGAAPEALLIVFDAQQYLQQVSVPVIVDNLVADGLIAPVAVVLVGNAGAAERAAELPPNPLFTRFLNEELMPWVEKQGVAQPPARTVIAGSSYGGLASAYAALRSPQRFGNVLSLSGSYWWAPSGERTGWMMREYASAPSSEPLRFYLDAGRYESARGARSMRGGILETNRHLADVLRAKGHHVTHVEHDTGHDYLHWQGSLGCGLVALLNPQRYRQGLAGCRQGGEP